jgi:hypothetical protein
MLTNGYVLLASCCPVFLAEPVISGRKPVRLHLGESHGRKEP